MSFIEDFDKLLFAFLWGKDKRPKIKRTVITNDIAEGGLKMIDFKNTIKSLKAVRVQRLLMYEWKNSDNKWVKIASNMIGAENKKLLLSKTTS